MKPLHTSRRIAALIGMALVAVLAVSGFGAVAVAPAHAAEAAPSGLRINGLDRPADLDDLESPALSWYVPSAEQSAYRVLVSTSEQAAEAGDGDVWDSDRVESSEQSGVPYAGPALAAGKRYFWTVQTFDGLGIASARSEVTWFGTAPGAAWEGSQAIWTSNQLPGSDDESTPNPWTDYTLTADVTVAQTALGVYFRATGTGESYMWQFRADTNELRPHIWTGGAFTQLDPIALPADAVRTGVPFTLAISTLGSTITTSINGTEVDRRELSDHATGTIGFRTGRSESGSVTHLSVVGTDGTALFSDPLTGANPFRCGTVAGGVLQVGNSTDCALPADPWADYALDANITIDRTALGVYFRAASDQNAYMWQFRADTNTLVPHTRINGTFTALPSVALPSGTLQTGKQTAIRISATGNTVTTAIGGVQVDTRTLSNFAAGTVGFRTGNSESGWVHDMTITRAGGGVVLANDFSATHPFPCGTLNNGAYIVSTAQSCVIAADASVSTDWAFLRTEISLPAKEIASATLFATAGDFRAHLQYAYKAYVNGAFVGLGPTNRIHSENRYDGFDVTALVTAGEANAVSALAYTSGSNRQRFIAQLRVEYTDGSTDVFGSGDSWKGMPGALAFPAAGSIGTGYFSAPKENWDARAYPHGFTEVGFDDSSWAPAVPTTAFADLQATPMAKVAEQTPAPVSIVDKGNGNYFVDFGRTWVGGVRYDIANGVSGAKVDIRFGEVPSAENTVKYQLNTGNVYQDIATLTDGQQTLETWGMRVFRYVEIVGAPEPVTVENLSALALVYPFDAEDSTFVSSDTNLNQVYQLSKNTIESLNVNFYTDSWTRERTNYEADAYLQLMSTLYLMDDLSLGRYSMNYFEANRTWPTEWPFYVVLAVHDAWRQTGDTEQVEAYFDNLESKMPTKWIDESTGLVRKTSGSNGCSSQTDCDIVDWPTSQRNGYQFRQVNTVVNALSYRAMRDMAAMAAEIGRDDRAAAYTEQADRLRDAMNERLYNAETGAYDDGMAADGTLTGHSALHASAFALAFGIPEADQQSLVAEYVASKGMACSVYCAGFSITGLFNGGADDAAVAQLTDTGTSSWMNMIALGAGSTAEAWDPSQKSNLTYSHPWAASPAFHVPSGLFGIKPIDAGYATYSVRPAPGGVDFARITVPTVKGSIGAAFSHAADDASSMRLVAQVPGNTRADLSIQAPAGTTTVYLDGVAREVEETGGYVTVPSVTAGCHLVTLDDGKSALADTNLTALCTPALVNDAEAESEGAATADADAAGAGASTEGNAGAGATSADGTGADADAAATGAEAGAAGGSNGTAAGGSGANANGADAGAVSGADGTDSTATGTAAEAGGGNRTDALSRTGNSAVWGFGVLALVLIVAGLGALHRTRGARRH
ncbi:family 78 glycoside hydrolase catalytic domain [Leucobacter japonicus]|uniref:family 78 glycoside hydrolase catalytic domain n=1 Tax=Leucobacter japonicus TaxID=1461259 RepID=UPI0006A7BA08|nr:family 78 glycoside hydrolase catalytic domain [Leucobacter japonicus]